MQFRDLTEEIRGLKADRERLRQRHLEGAGGYEIVRDLSDSVDRAITKIWWRVRPSDPVAIVALGGYGRRELCPSSDIDLMVLHRSGDEVNGSAKALLYELWDAGMQVGHSIRTVKEALRLARQEFDAETSFLEARLVTGDLKLFEQFHAAVLRQSKKSPASFLDRIAKATQVRRSRAGDASAELEPNLKDGRGALRDLHTIGWIEKICGTRELPVDRSALESAGELLYRARTALHFVTGRQSDALLMQLQQQVAAYMGLTDGSSVSSNGNQAETPGAHGKPPEETLMRNLYLGCRAVAFALDWILDPEYRQIARRLPPPLLAGTWNPEARNAFIDVLASGSRGRRAFTILEQTGALERLIPEWESIRCLPQRNVYHRNAVDVHSFETAAVLSKFVSAGERDTDPGWDGLTRRVAADTRADWDRLLLAALLHDIGKGTLEDHSVRGERLARAAVERIGLPPSEAEDVAWLVRNHLMLTKAAVRRNIDDESLIVELAEAVGSVARLRMLYLVSVADGLSTGPAAWSDWTAALVSELFTRIFHMLEQGELVSGDASQVAEENLRFLGRALADLPADQVAQHLGDMPRIWLISQPTSALIRQSRLMVPRPEATEVRLDAIPLSESGLWEITVVATDRPGLFSKVSGVLALHGLDVLASQIFTSDDRVALEVFRVAGTDERLERVSEDIQRALRGKISLDLRLAQKRSEYAGRVSKGRGDPPSVRVDNKSSDFYTVIEVHCSDRIGLLYTITRALADLELDIHLAKVATYAEDVVDVFYVSDLEGQKVTDPEQIREIQRLIAHRLNIES
jgi:[protein-PII] uridylyltransferase